MKVRCHTPRPQGQYPYISPAQFIPQRIRERLLAGLVRMIYGLARERRSLQTSDRSDIEDRARIARNHGVVEDGVGEEHVAVDIGGVHGGDFLDGKLVECLGGTDGKASLFHVLGYFEFILGLLVSSWELLTLFIRISTCPISSMDDATAASTSA